MLPSEAPLAIDRAAILPTVLWAQALLVVVAIATWAWLRAIRPVVWVGIAPALLFVSWNLFENLAALLPNTL
jgi:sortase A